MNNSIFFSVITPNYNSGDKLVRSIKSLGKNNISFEHIIVDDCSDDNSFSLVKKIVEETSLSNLVLLQNQSNSGPGHSRNQGLDVARGEYIIFMDADDYLVDHALDDIYSMIKSKDKIDVLTFKHEKILNDNHIFRTSHTQTQDVIRVIDPLRDYLLDKIISSPWCKCIKSSLAKEFKFPDLRVSQDAPYNLDIFNNTIHVYESNSTLYLFDKTNNDSITRKPFDKVELSKFYKSWCYFEDKALKELTLIDSKELISARKIIFCSSYYISRLIISKGGKDDEEIIRFIKNIISQNLVGAWSKINIKFKGLCLVFYSFPNTTIFILRKIRPYGL